MSNLVKSQIVNGIQSLTLGQYARRDIADNQRSPLSSESVLLDPSLPEYEGDAAEISIKDDNVLIENACRLAFEHGHAEGLKDALKEFSYREDEIERARQLIQAEMDEVSEKKRAFESLIAEVKARSDSDSLSVEMLAVNIATHAVKELIEVGLTNSSGIVQLIKGLVEKLRNESPILEIRCGMALASMLGDSYVASIKVSVDSRRADYEFELRTQDSFYSVDIERYVRAIFEAFSQKVSGQHDQ